MSFFPLHFLCLLVLLHVVFKCQGALEINHSVCTGQQSTYRGNGLLFQAEDGIRDYTPSRGLGDVYKRQLQKWTEKLSTKIKQLQDEIDKLTVRNTSVSYTHLTLPTRSLV